MAYGESPIGKACISSHQSINLVKESGLKEASHNSWQTISQEDQNDSYTESLEFMSALLVF